MNARDDMPGTMTTVGWLTPRAHVGRPPVCQVDATVGGYCRLVVFDEQGNGKTLFTVPVVQIDNVALDVGDLVIRVDSRKYRIILAPPGTTAKLGMTTMATASATGASAAALGGAALAGYKMARREKLVDPEGLRWLRLFADHGVPVAAPARWKPRVRYGLMGIAVLITAIGVLGSVAGVAEEGGWTAEARNGVIGMAVFVTLIWMIWWLVARLLRGTERRDTVRRVEAVPS
jgi:hypothetical protein